MRETPLNPVDEGPTQRYERLAAEFFRETGLMAPGKDVPASCASHSYEERWGAWTQWLNTRAPGHL